VLSDDDCRREIFWYLRSAASSLSPVITVSKVKIFIESRDLPCFSAWSRMSLVVARAWAMLVVRMNMPSAWRDANCRPRPATRPLVEWSNVESLRARI
jgi:hypothetical protein